MPVRREDPEGRDSPPACDVGCPPVVRRAMKGRAKAFPEIGVIAMTTSRDADRQHDSAGPVAGPQGVVQIHLEELGKHSWTEAVLGAVIGAGGGPAYRFVAAPADPDHDASEHAAVGAKFPVMPFRDLKDLTEPDEWTDRAHQRLNELDAELTSRGWRRRAERGHYWWSLRYDKPQERTT